MSAIAFQASLFRSSPTGPSVDPYGVFGPRVGGALVVSGPFDPNRFYSAETGTDVWIASDYQGGMYYANYNSRSDGGLYYELPVYCYVPTIARFWCIADPQAGDGGIVDIYVDGKFAAGPGNSFSGVNGIVTGQRLEVLNVRLTPGQRLLRLRKLNSRSVYVQDVTLETA